MYQQFYRGMELGHLSLFALLLFLAVFAAVVLRTLSPRSAAIHRELSLLPLADGETPTPAPGRDP